MKYLLLLSLFLCACIPPENMGVNILPSPQQFELKEGKFLFDASTGVFADSVFFEQIPYLKSISSQPLNGESTTIALLYEGAFSDEEYILDINEDTIAIFQMRFPGNIPIPSNGTVNQPPRIGNIGSPCFIFHSKYLKDLKWDGWKCGDFRFIEKVYNKIPNKVAIEKMLVTIGQIGDGKREDI